MPRRFVLRQRFKLVLAILSTPPPSKAAMSSAVTEPDDRTDLVNRLVGSRSEATERERELRMRAKKEQRMRE
uniref:IBB domain-containing protein n=1 Tax=Fagus sylvatica TaxID=28930 RepID=A0A2N9ESB4_FAGSY